LEKQEEEEEEEEEKKKKKKNLITELSSYSLPEHRSRQSSGNTVFHLGMSGN
jgi:hypothetical protein